MNKTQFSFLSFPAAEKINRKKNMFHANLGPKSSRAFSGFMTLPKVLNSGMLITDDLRPRRPFSASRSATLACSLKILEVTSTDTEHQSDLGAASSSSCFLRSLRSGSTTLRSLTSSCPPGVRLKNGSDTNCARDTRLLTSGVFRYDRNESLGLQILC